MADDTESSPSPAASVSVVIPCFNEEATIDLLLEALHAQSYPRDRLEIIIADGMSTDRTRERIAAFQKDHPDLLIRIVDNPVRAIPSGVNRGIEAAEGEYIVRLDAHSVPNPDYVRFSIENLQAGLGQNVGGVWDIKPGGPDWQARAIAVAAAHPLGVGDALYRHTRQAQAVDTVPFGAFAHALTDRLGALDETLLANEDYEFNARIRADGGTIWLDPRIRAVYFARSSLARLARQYGRYGFWKLRMLRRYPKTLRWRQALPPLLVIGCLSLLLTGLALPGAWWLLGTGLASYFLILGVGSMGAGLRAGGPLMLLAVPLAIAVMHFSWGGAFLWSLTRPPHA